MSRPNRSGLALTGLGQAGTREWAVSIGIGPAKAEPNPMPPRFGFRRRKALAAQEVLPFIRPHGRTPRHPYPDRPFPSGRVNTTLREATFPVNQTPTIPKRRSIGLGLMLLVCFAILSALLPRQSPAIPYSGFMPSDLWVVSRDEIPAARLWIHSIFAGYVALGVVGWLRGTRLLCFAVPVLMAAGSLLALLRFGIGTGAFSR